MRLPHTPQFPADWKQHWITCVRVPMAAIMCLASPPASPHHISTSYVPTFERAPVNDPLPAPLPHLTLPWLFLPLHCYPHSLLSPERPPQHSLLIQKPQALLLSLTLLTLLNSLDLFLMYGQWMNFKKFVTSSLPHEHAMFSLLSQPLWGSYALPGRVFPPPPSPLAPRQHTHFTLCPSSQKHVDTYWDPLS